MVEMAEINHMHRRKELAFFDPNSKRSLANLLPGEMASQMRLVWNGELGELFHYNEHSLIAAMNRAGHGPDALDYTLRLRFWMEFNRCQDEDWQYPKLDLPLVLGRDIARERFYKFYIMNSYKLVFMLTPPVQYRQALECALQATTAKLQDFINQISLYDPGTKNPNGIAVDKLLKIHEMLATRVAQAQGVSGGGPKRGRPRAGEVTSETPPPGVPRSLDEQLEEMRSRNEELERLRSSDIKKETGAL